MNTYTIKELLTLIELIRSFPIASKIKDTSELNPVFAIRNIANIINNYKFSGPEKIFEKIKEFAEIGKTTRSDISIKDPPLVLVYNLIYEENLDTMPLYIETPYEPIAAWRLSLPKQS